MGRKKNSVNIFILYFMIYSFSYNTFLFNVSKKKKTTGAFLGSFIPQRRSAFLVLLMIWTWQPRGALVTSLCSLLFITSKNQLYKTKHENFNNNYHLSKYVFKLFLNFIIYYQCWFFFKLCVIFFITFWVDNRPWKAEVIVWCIEWI